MKEYVADKRYRVQIQGFNEPRNIIAKNETEAIGIAVDSVRKLPGLTTIERWPGESNKYEVSNAGHRVATVTILSVDE
jgi:hypothetical protein